MVVEGASREGEDDVEDGDSVEELEHVEETEGRTRAEMGMSGGRGCEAVTVGLLVGGCLRSETTSSSSAARVASINST